MSSRLKNLREILELTQAELAQDLGISRQSLISLEKGKCKPSIDLAQEIADFFEMPIELIFPYDNDHGESRMPWSDSSPFRELSRMHQEIERMFGDSFFSEKIEEKKFIKINPKEIKLKITKDKLIIEIPKK